MKILFVLYEGWPGVSTNLKSISAVIKQIQPNADISFLRLDGSKLGINVIRFVKTDPPDLLITGGWDSNIKTIIQNVIKTKIKVFLQWCSPVTQIELGGEITRFIEAINFMKLDLIDFFGIPLQSDYDLLSKLYPQMVFTPICINQTELSCVKEDKTTLKGDKINCDLFCAPCLRKNILSQMISLSEFKEQIFVHLNYQPVNPNLPYFNAAETFLDKIHRNHSWMDRSRYLSVLKGMDFSCQVSLSESFNYTAAEHMFFSIPVLISKAFPIAKRYSELAPLVVEKSDDLSEISAKMKRLIEEESFRKEMGEISRSCLLDLNEKNYLTLKETLKNILERCF